MKKLAKKILIKLFGLETFIYYRSLARFRKLNIANVEIDDFYFFLDMIKPGHNVLDIGANVGFMTILLSRKVAHGNVYAFEPVEMTFNVLKRMINRYKLKNVTLYNKALGNENKMVTMNMPIFDGFVSDMGSYIMYDHYYFNNPNVKTVEVEQVSIDFISEIMNKDICAVKIDVENYEYFVLSGAKNFINLKRPIIYSELWYGSENQANVFKLMEELNYTLLVYDKKKLVTFNPEIHKKSNFFFIPSEKTGDYI